MAGSVVVELHIPGCNCAYFLSFGKAFSFNFLSFLPFYIRYISRNQVIKFDFMLIECFKQYKLYVSDSHDSIYKRNLIEKLPAKITIEIA